MGCKSVQLTSSNVVQLPKVKRDRRKSVRITQSNIMKLGPGRNQDKGTPGLYLFVTGDGQIRRWIFRFTSPVSKAVTETGLGPWPAIAPDDARDKAHELRKQIVNGICPIAARRADRAVATTFAEAADAWIETHKPGWRSASQLKNARILLHQHGAPLAKVPVSEVNPDKIQSALEELWVRHPAQARRALAMFERVLDFARAKGWRNGDNPASWRGMHEYRFPRQKSKELRHFAALPYVELPEFVRKLRVRQSRSSGAVALEFTILTATRTGEVLGMQWSEIDWDNRVWTLPAERTKQGRQHQVPLCNRAMKLLEEQRHYSPGSEYVFTGYKRDRLAEKSMVSVLKNLRVDVTVHGFRSTFRDWAGDMTDFAREHVEECLAHSVGNGTERAYRRQNGLEKRRLIMEEWSGFCG
jgi:integrase